MNQVSAFPLGRIAGAKTTDDGQVMLLQTIQPDGQETIFGVPCDQLLSLVDMAALGLLQSNKATNVSSEQKTAFNVSWWEIGFVPLTKDVILSLTFGAGGRLDFRLATGMPEQILETLRVHLGQGTSEKENKPAH
jgi:hypothetical protein